MKKISILIVIIFVLPLFSCGQNLRTLNQVKTNLVCIKVEKGVDWTQISEKMGSPDIAPRPESGADLDKNARIYRGKMIIIHVVRERIQEDGKMRFHEVLSEIELCQDK